MTPPSFEQVLTQIAGALARSAPQAALAESLALAHELGVVPARERDDGATFATWTHGARTLALAGGAALDSDLRARLADLLRVAFTRAAEHDELQAVRERMELLSAASFEGLFFHVDGVIVDANQRLSELLGDERAELLGDRTLRRCVAPEDLPAVLQRITSGYEGEYVVTVIRKDGSRFRAEIQANQGKLGDRPVRVAAVRDVSERERTQALLRESEGRLRTLAETAFDATVFSRDGVIRDVAGAFEPLLGYKREQMVGRTIVEFLGQKSVPFARQMIAEQQPGVFRALALAASGEEIPIEVAAVHTTLQGESVRMSAMRDQREFERRERERRELELMLERSQRLESLGVRRT